MKRMMFAAAILVTSFMSAQIMVNTNGGEITNNQQFTFSNYGPNNQVPFIVTNTSEDETINLKLRCNSFSNTDGTNLQFCFGGTCLFFVTEGLVVPPTFWVTLEPGQSTFVGDHFFNNNPGNGMDPIDFSFTFIKLDDEGNYLSDLLSFSYRYTPTLGTQTVDLTKAGVRNMNTLVDNQLLLDLSEKVKFELFNANGQLVKSANLDAGQNSVDASDLSAGIYVAHFANEKNAKAQVKVMKK